MSMSLKSFAFLYNLILRDKKKPLMHVCDHVLILVRQQQWMSKCVSLYAFQLKIKESIEECKLVSSVFIYLNSIKHCLRIVCSPTIFNSFIGEVLIHLNSKKSEYFAAVNGYKNWKSNKQRVWGHFGSTQECACTVMSINTKQNIYLFSFESFCASLVSSLT